MEKYTLVFSKRFKVTENGIGERIGYQAHFINRKNNERAENLFFCTNSSSIEKMAVELRDYLEEKFQLFTKDDVFCNFEVRSERDAISFNWCPYNRITQCYEPIDVSEMINIQVALTNVSFGSYKRNWGRKSKTT